jgi:hypothetical protein
VRARRYRGAVAMWLQLAVLAVIGFLYGNTHMKSPENARTVTYLFERIYRMDDVIRELIESIEENSKNIQQRHNCIDELFAC